MVHSKLARHLPKTADPREFAMVSQILYMLLDKKLGSMTQWHIEVTLATVSQVCSEKSPTRAAKPSIKVCSSLHRLVEIILKRHRLRLEGHFHILITALQSLLESLITHPVEKAQEQEKLTKSYAR